MAMSEQLSEDDDIAAAQVLSMGVTRYAGATIKTAVGEPPPGSNILEALARARQIIGTAVHLPAPVASALRDLQMIAVLFTMQLTISDGHGAPEVLRQLGDKLVSALKQDAARVHAHDCAVAAAGLLVAGETYPHYSYHLREVCDTPINLGGHVAKPLSLYGRLPQLLGECTIIDAQKGADA